MTIEHKKNERELKVSAVREKRRPAPDVGAAAVRELLDKQAITELVYNYSRAVDRRDFELLASLYTTDGVDDHAGLYSGDAAGFVDWLREALEGVDITTHHVHNLLLAIDGDRAEGEVYVTAYNRIPNAQNDWDDFLQGLRYLDRYRREDGGWRFSHRTVVCDWAQNQPAFWDAENPLLSGKRFGVAGEGDASYRCLSQALFARGQDNP